MVLSLVHIINRHVLWKSCNTPRDFSLKNGLLGKNCVKVKTKRGLLAGHCVLVDFEKFLQLLAIAFVVFSWQKRPFQNTCTRRNHSHSSAQLQWKTRDFSAGAVVVGVKFILNKNFLYEFFICALRKNGT